MNVMLHFVLPARIGEDTVSSILLIGPEPLYTTEGDRNVVDASCIVGLEGASRFDRMGPDTPLERAVLGSAVFGSAPFPQ